ncbi:MAG TPA: pitrilysin family protein [Longimicrobium sp.]|nr:pitrilysin family protein [Longimicrobium sp.]
MPESIAPPTAARLHVASRTRALANGMRVIAHEDRSAPLVAVHLMYRAGSRDERPGRTGLAHLLEHLMFEGSLHAPKGHFDDALERVGGTNNGSTWLDRTNYYETVPTHAVELPLWLERDRMAFFLPVLTGEVLEVQRGVVINERRQVYENRPYGMADQRLHEMLFGQGHPYSWPTIGYMEDLERITLEDAREFYATYYTPGNAVLAFAGDLAAEDAFALAERWFGDLPGGPEIPPAPLPADPAPAAAVARETMEDAVSFPRVYQAWAVPGYGTREWVALDVLAYLLADGDSSRLQRALVREGRLAQDVDTYLYPTALAGVFGVVATARSGIAPEALEEAVRRELDAVARDGVTDDELLGAVRRVRRDQVTELATVEERAEALAYAATVLGDAGALDRVWELYAEITPEEVSRAAAAFLAGDRGATLVVVPGADTDGEEGDEEYDDEEDGDDA